ncbi:MAG: hypothetical protein GY795_26855 [Desulfobacterales bacterium]|nr:hypothetical protein [Desulfobacterales bacterium]
MLIIDWVLIMTGAVIWELWKSEKDNRNTQINNINNNYEKTLSNLKTEIADMSCHLSQLQEKFSEVQKSPDEIPAKNIYVHPGTSAGRISKSSGDSSRRGMLKQIIDDNIKLRETENLK